MQEGRRVKLPVEGDLEADALERERQKKQFGVDPRDIEAMLSVSFPRPSLAAMERSGIAARCKGWSADAPISPFCGL